MATNKSQQTRLITALSSGSDFTTKQIASRLNVSESRARFLITELREQGYAIYRNRKTLTSGKVLSVYRLGTPSKAMVSAAYAFEGASLFA